MIINGGTSGGGWCLWAAWMLFVVGWALRAHWTDRARRKKLQSTLFALDFVPLKALPSTLAGLDSRLTRGTLLSGYQGRYKDREATVLDLRFGAGKSSFQQTFVALKRMDDQVLIIPPIISALQLQYRQYGRWLIGTIDRQTMDDDAVLGYLECFV